MALTIDKFIIKVFGKKINDMQTSTLFKFHLISAKLTKFLRENCIFPPGNFGGKLCIKISLKKNSRS